MPPLTGAGERLAPRATWFCIDAPKRSPVALALRVFPLQSRVRPGGIACSAPRHEQRESTPSEPQAPRDA
jgi:hypothetical protein